MRKVLILIAVVLLLIFTGAWISEIPDAPTAGAAGIGDPYFPELGNGGYDAQHYTIDLDADLSISTIAGTVTMDAIATQSLSAFNLDFAGFEISRITVNGTDATFSRDGRELTITPASSIALGDRFSVAVTYSGVPGRNTGIDRLPFARGWTFYAGGSYVASEPDGASLWYPVNDHPTDKATYSFFITTDSAYDVAANGTLQSITDVGNSKRTFHWETTEPVASYLVTVNIAPFARQDDTVVDDVPIRNYFPVELEASGIETFADQAEMMRFYNDIYGTYPFEAYGSVVANMRLPFALETQTLSLFGTNILSDPDPNFTISHELAHSWFGNHVSPHMWRDIWINEGFATYSTVLWIEEHVGEEEADAMMRGWYERIGTSSVTIGDPGARNMFSLQVYLRGALTLHALRIEVGDEAFFDILPTFQHRYAHSTASIADFIMVAEEISRQDLGALFDAWLYSTELPPLDI